jgi:predicted DNA-binding WGR domain protein
VAAVFPAVPPPVKKPDLVRRCHYEEGGNTRFWEATLTGCTVKITFGTVGGKQSVKERIYPTPAAATQTIADQISEKLDDDFVEVDPETHKPLGAKSAPAAKSKPAPAAPAEPVSDGPEGTRRFEFVSGTSSKFWEVWTEGSTMYTRYGRIGSTGQTTMKSYADDAAARKEADKMIREKTGKGYEEMT